MDATVVICTWNRADLLDQTLERMRGLTVPAGLAWEIVVVNNNCTDHTSAVVEKHAGHLLLRHVVETKQGHSNARNRGVAETRGKLLIWTDDDVLVPARWLAEYVAAAEHFPQASFFGGPVKPWFERTPPSCVTRNLDRIGHTWALMDHGDAVRPLAKSELLYGANFAFRTDVLRKYPFDPNLGRMKGKLTGGDETTVIERAWADGHTGVWVGTAPVDHYIPADRVNVGYVWELERCAGEVAARSFVDHTSRFRGAPRWFWRRYLGATLRRFLHAPTASRTWLEAVMEQAKFRGMIDQFQAAGKPA